MTYTTMKKTYITPSVICVVLRATKMIATSLQVDKNTSTETQYVKEDIYNRSSSYDVWSDDWSN